MELKKSGLEKTLLIKMYRTMKTSRLLDERLNLLNRAGKVGFNISGMGHEGAEIGCAYAFDLERDYALPYYRDLGIMLAWGVSVRDIMLGSFGKAEDPGSGSRQMPCHWGNKEHRIPTGSSPVSTQYPHAAGIAYGAKLAKDPLVVYCSTGDGASNQGDFHEGLNFAAVHKLPVVYVIYNNRLAISVGPELQYAAAKLSDRAVGYGMPGETVDGNDVIAVYQATERAVQRAKAGEGPTLLEFDVVRYTSHSTDDDDKVYRDQEPLEEAKAYRDPVALYEQALLAEGYLTSEELTAISKEIKDVINAATEYADQAPMAAPEEALRYVYDEQGGLSRG